MVELSLHPKLDYSNALINNIKEATTKSSKRLCWVCDEEIQHDQCRFVSELLDN